MTQPAPPRAGMRNTRGCASLLLCLFLAPPSGTADARLCPADRIDERVVSAEVYDGDTLRLVDGRTLRLLGMDTPELGDEGAPPEAYAGQAEQLLSRLAAPGTALGLRYDVVRQDKYQRTLAHAFLTDGTNLQQRLLESGLATTLVIPPNGWLSDCYAEAEANARSAASGLWSLPRYQSVAAGDLSTDALGYRLVTGRVQRVGESTGAVWLNLAIGMALRLPRENLVYFDSYDPRSLTGRLVLARGKLYQRKGELRMTLRHPSALTLLD